jgi:hypothetical protein
VRRRLIIIVLLLAGGAIINVAVAWGTAGWLRLRSDGNVLEFSVVSVDEVELWRQWAPEEKSSEPVVSSNVANWGARVLCIGATRSPDDTEIYSDDDGRVLSYRLRNLQSRPEVQQFDHALFIRSGWPASAMFGARWCEGDPKSAATSAEKILLLKPKGYSTTLVSARTFALRTYGKRNLAPIVEYRVIPMAPIWPGFAINMLFYPGVLWLLFVARFAFRKRRRIKRGLCPKCAYDLRATQSPVCPECGATR